MVNKLEEQDLELLRQIADLNSRNAQMEMQIGANHKEIAELELKRKELRVYGARPQRNLQGELLNN